MSRIQKTVFDFLALKYLFYSYVEAMTLQD